MSDIPTYPKTPIEWLQYAESKIVSSISLNEIIRLIRYVLADRLLTLVSDWSQEADKRG